MADRETTLLPLELIDPAPDNPRSSLGDLTELTANIKTQGVLVAITVVPRGDRYEVGFGHRRRQAAIDAGLIEIPVEIRHDWAGNERGLRAARIAEQMNREDWNVMDRARAFSQLAGMDLSQRKIAELVGVNQSTVSKHLTMLKLPEPVQECLVAGAISQERALFVADLDEDWQERISFQAQAPDGLEGYLEWLEERMARERAVKAKADEIAEDHVVYADDEEATKAKAKALTDMPWVNVAKHRALDCRAVVVWAPFDERRQMVTAPRITEYCTTPRNHPRPTRHQDGATRETAADNELDTLLTELERARETRLAFLAGTMPEPVETILEAVRALSADHGAAALGVLGLAIGLGDITTVDDAVRVLWLTDMLDREAPNFAFRNDHERPTHVDNFVLRPGPARDAQGYLAILGELGYVPSWIELMRADLPYERPEETKAVDDSDGITIEVTAGTKGRFNVRCTACGGLGFNTKEETAAKRGDDHLWEVHGIAKAPAP